MRKYFYVKDGLSLGPYSIEELRAQGISAETLVWCEGMPDWVPAKNVAELASILPPPLPSMPDISPPRLSQLYEAPAVKQQPQQPYPQQQQQPKPAIPENFTAGSIIVLIFSVISCNIFSIVFSIIALIQSGNIEKLYLTNDYEGSAKASKNASTWFYLALVFMIFGFFIYLIAFFFSASNSLSP